jgi:adenosine kinase
LLPKKNQEKPRTVIITQGADETIVVIGNSTDKEVEKQTFSVPKMNENDIVDSNGAGDAFAGAFMACWIQGKSLKECIDTGHWLAQWVLKATGPQ